MSRNALSEKPFDYVAAKKNRDAWIAVAHRVINGDYNRADASTVLSLTIGLRGYSGDHDCQRALKILSPDPKNK